jgi:hypothetical protein
MGVPSVWEISAMEEAVAVRLESGSKLALSRKWFKLTLLGTYTIILIRGKNRLITVIFS